MRNNISLIGYRCGIGAQIKECQKGPDSLKEWYITQKAQRLGINLEWKEFTDIIVKNHSAEELIELHCKNLYRQVTEVLKSNRFPICIGGDHSMAIGTWSTIADYYQIKQQLGLIWIDAHLDAHTMQTSPSKAIHGMPAACLVGKGINRLVDLGSEGIKIDPKHIVYIGIRSYESDEYILLKESGAYIYTMEDVYRKGIPHIIRDAIEIVTSGTQGFGLTIDLDAFDPAKVPGVGSPERDGLLRREIFYTLQGLGHHKDLKALEIAEYNPDKDIDNITKRTIFHLIASMFN